MITLQFLQGTGFASQTIEWFSAGHLSHVDCVMPDGKLLGSRSDVIGGVPAGVQERPFGYYGAKVKTKVFTLPATADQQAKYYGFLLRQINKPYDKTAIWGFALGRDWRERDSWICSELQAAAAEYAGIFGELYSPVNKITPVTLAVVVSALS